MSGHGHHEADANSHAGHDDHHETSSDDFPADEPHSPGWLPLLGGGLLLAGILAIMVFGADETVAAADGAQPTAAVAPAQPVRPAAIPAARPAPGLRPGVGMPPGHAQFVQQP